jgi:D-alanyl-D-alanine endopeptidase (penicillin-binding protein 7)
MEITLRAVFLWLVVVAMMALPIASVHALEKVRSKAEAQKDRGNRVAAKSVAKPAAKVAAKPGSGTVAARPAAKKVAQPVARNRAAPPVAQNDRAAKGRTVARAAGTVAAARSGKGTSRAATARAPALARNGTSSRRAVASSNQTVASNRVVARSVEPAVQKRHLTRAVATDADFWQDPGRLAVQSGAALVIAEDSGELLYEKNASAVVPIASITKLMTAMVVLDSLPNLQAPITISDEDVDYLRGSRSRLGVGTEITRETALLLALMSSENRAANALGRHYPGGLRTFVAAMNRKAASLGMNSTRFEDPTGLNSNNVSTAHDLARMVAAAHRYPLIREFSTTPGFRAEVKGRDLAFHNTNQLVHNPGWEIGVSKTGYIQEAGKCLVMQARVADKPVVIVLLDSAGKQTRIGDAIRIRRWMESVSATGRATPPTRG